MKNTRMKVKNEYVITLKAAFQCISSVPFRKNLLSSQGDSNHFLQSVLRGVVSWVNHHADFETLITDVEAFFVSVCNLGYASAVLTMLVANFKTYLNNLDDVSKIEVTVTLLHSCLSGIDPISVDDVNQMISTWGEVNPKTSERGNLNVTSFCKIFKSIKIKNSSTPQTVAITVPAITSSSLKDAVNSNTVMAFELLSTVLGLLRRISSSNYLIENGREFNVVFPTIKNLFGKRVNFLANSDTALGFLKTLALYHEVFPMVFDEAKLPVQNIVDSELFQSLSRDCQRLVVRFLTSALKTNQLAFTSMLSADYLPLLFFNSTESKFLAAYLLSFGNNELVLPQYFFSI
ncbi:hypothetical protein GEMRC1_003148 [Eukaryota sp. GEM-RC1]